jgi:multiphosphoryl transfer protein
MTNRISRLKTALFANTREISLERALLYTASHRQTEGEPVILRRAKATAYILEHVEISIRDEELIAGNRTVKPRAGIMSPEMDPYWLLKELDQFPTRPQDRFAISEEDKRIYREELFPYWEKRSMKDFINGQMTDEVKAATNTQIFSINQTDKGQGHIIIDYPRLLNHGLGELVAQMQQHCQQQPENHFYQAALLLLEASQKHILRYAELAETMAANCTDAQRREELLTIAEISRHNAQHKPQTFWQACQLFWYMNIILQYEQEAHQRLSQWLRDEFPHCDAPLAEVKSDELEPLPVSLTNLNPQIIRARTVCSGSAGGILTPISSLDLNALGNLPAAKGVDAEQSALENGLTLVLKNIEFRLLDSDGATSAILEAHRSLAGDTSLREHLLAGVSAGLSCAEAIVASANHFCEEFSRSSSSYLQERALDVRDVCFQLLQQIYGEQRFPAPGKLTQPAICMADELTPSQFLELDKNHLKGLLLKSGGTTSHTVILARSFNIPTLVGVDIDALTPWQQQTIYIDGNAGAIVVEPGEAVARYYQQEARVQDALREQQRVWLTQQARTADGIRIEIAANIAHSVEAQAAFGNGAEGVGLFRTEMLYMDRTSAPGESELYNIFCQALESANGRSIIVRTMDIGGDKPVDYLNIPAEANPFLGYRAVRIYEEYASLFTTQLRSILRASAHGSLKIMIPMISSMEEILWVKEKLAEAKQWIKRPFTGLL